MDKELSEDDQPQINIDKVCFVIMKSRELRAEDEGVAADASNATDDGSRVILTDNAFAGIRQELAEFIAALDVDEASELVALAWVGRGDFDASEWTQAVNTARERKETPTSRYLLGMPLLPDHLEEGLDAFGESCRDFDA